MGSLIKTRVEEYKMDLSRIISVLNLEPETVEEMYQSESLDSEMLLRWSKLLEYDFFRIYTQHLILYSPASGTLLRSKAHKDIPKIPQFRKSIYSKEIIFFIVEMIKSGEKTTAQIISEYNIPKTTLMRWLYKYSG